MLVGLAYLALVLRCDAGTRAAGGKVSFRGFRGRYRLTWKDASGKEQSKLVDVAD